MRHLLSVEQLTRADIRRMLDRVAEFKQHRKTHARSLDGQTWALIFAKSSTRTRVSFEVGIHELGGRPLFLNAADIQLGRGEPIQDTARVLGRMVHGAVIRTYAQRDVEEFARHAGIPTVNALTDVEHPCQILTDLLTYEEKRGPISGRTVAFFGDAACNVANSWLFAAGRLDFELRLASAPEFQPAPELVQRSGARVVLTEDPVAAARDAHLLYTDVWVSMGKEAEEARRLQILAPYQLNEAVVKHARPDALVMHCLPAYRGREIDAATFEAHAGTIFDQAENRLHTQKAILDWLVRG